MMALKVTVKDSFGKWLGGLGGMFRRKGAAAGQEISAVERPPAQNEAEEALWQAMGWDVADGENALQVVKRAAGEALASR